MDVPLSSAAIPLVTPTGAELVYLSVPGSPPTDGKATVGTIAAFALGTLEATLNGSVAGHAYVYVQSAAHLKRYYLVLVGWNDAGQTYNWGSAFAAFANLLQNMSPPVTSVSITNIVLPATGGAVNAIIEVMGA